MRVSERLEHQVALVLEVFRFGFGFGCLDPLSSSRWLGRFGGFVVVRSRSSSFFFLASLSLGSFPHYWWIDFLEREKSSFFNLTDRNRWIRIQILERERNREGILVWFFQKRWIDAGRQIGFSFNFWVLTNHYFKGWRTDNAGQMRWKKWENRWLRVCLAVWLRLLFK